MHVALYSPRLDDAVGFALDAFRSRVRKGTRVPYMTHLLSVMCIVAEYGGDEDQLIAAVLHDWLEDIPGAATEVLEARWGARVARLVEGLSDSAEHPKPPWEPRKRAYLAKLREEPAELKLISCADKLHNCMSIRRDLEVVGLEIFNRFTGGQHGTLWYYRAVVEALGEGWSHPLHQRLTAEVEMMVREAERLQEAQ